MDEQKGIAEVRPQEEKTAQAIKLVEREAQNLPPELGCPPPKKFVSLMQQERGVKRLYEAPRLEREGELTGEKFSTPQGELVVDKQLGSGAEGEVYKARFVDKKKQEEIGSPIVVKILGDERFRGSFKEEQESLRIHSCDDPPLLPRFVTAGEEEGIPFTVMEEINSPNIPEHIKEHGVLEEFYAVTMVAQLSSFFEKEESDTIPKTCRDLKLEDIHIEDHQIRMVDYGVSVIEEEADKKTGIAQVSRVLLYLVSGYDLSHFPGKNEVSRSHLEAIKKARATDGWQNLSCGAKQIILKGLGFIDGGYRKMEEFHQDLKALAVIHFEHGFPGKGEPDEERVQKAIQKGSSEAVRQALGLTFLSLAVNKEEAVRRFAKRKIEELEKGMEKTLSRPWTEKELDDERKHFLEFLPHYLRTGRSIDKSFLERMDSYIGKRPMDLFIRKLRGIAGMQVLIKESGLLGDFNFWQKYPEFCEGLVLRKNKRPKLLPEKESIEKAQPLFTLGNLILEVRKVLG